MCCGSNVTSVSTSSVCLTLIKHLVLSDLLAIVCRICCVTTVLWKLTKSSSWKIGASGHSLQLLESIFWAICALGLFLNYLTVLAVFCAVSALVVLYVVFSEPFWPLRSTPLKRTSVKHKVRLVHVMPSVPIFTQQNKEKFAPFEFTSTECTICLSACNSLVPFIVKQYTFVLVTCTPLLQPPSNSRGYKASDYMQLC